VFLSVSAASIVYLYFFDFCVHDFVIIPSTPYLLCLQAPNIRRPHLHHSLPACLPTTCDYRAYTSTLKIYQHTHRHTHAYAHTHTHTRARAHTRTHAHMHTHTHTRTTAARSACRALPELQGAQRHDQDPRGALNTHKHTHTHTHAQCHDQGLRGACVSVCACVCVCACVYVCSYKELNAMIKTLEARVRVRERERESESERERDRERECVCVQGAQ
jgi:hypothetical protein